MSKHWYTVQAISNKEKAAAASIKERIERSPLKDMFGEVLVPEEQVTELKNGKSVTSYRKFYPGYVLVEMEMNDETRYLVRGSANVIDFLGSKNKPMPLSKKEMDKILGQMEESKKEPVQKQTFEIGEIVRIDSGPFKDFEGMVESVNYNTAKVKVSISVFGRPTPTDFEFKLVQKKE